MISQILSSLEGIEHSFGEKGDLPPQGVITLKQVHGTATLLVETGKENGDAGFDIVMTKQKNIPIGIRTADCQSLLAVDPEAHVIAAIHAGWKGTVQRATEVGIQKMIDLGARAERIRVALGPSMLKSCYEVEEDVASQFQKQFPDWPEILEQKSEKKWLLDVALTNKKQLLKMGIKSENIDHLDYCTHCDPQRLESFRRDGDRSGRMVSWIKVKG